MRIISGLFGGRIFGSPKGRRTHPMSEKMRGALFSVLGDISDLAFLDAYSGSGALSLEAISRGASSSIAIDQDQNAYKSIKKTVESLGLSERVHVTRANISSWSSNNQSMLFDVVICDPPYDDIRPDIIRKLTRHVKNTGVFVLSYPGSEPALIIDGLNIVSTKNYGDSQLIFYKH